MMSFAGFDLYRYLTSRCASTATTCQGTVTSVSTAGTCLRSLTEWWAGSTRGSCWTWVMGASSGERGDLADSSSSPGSCSHYNRAPARRPVCTSDWTVSLLVISGLGRDCVALSSVCSKTAVSAFLFVCQFDSSLSLYICVRLCSLNTLDCEKVPSYLSCFD